MNTDSIAETGTVKIRNLIFNWNGNALTILEFVSKVTGQTVSILLTVSIAQVTDLHTLSIGSEVVSVGASETDTIVSEISTERISGLEIIINYTVSIAQNESSITTQTSTIGFVISSAVRINCSAKLGLDIEV